MRLRSKGGTNNYSAIVDKLMIFFLKFEVAQGKVSIDDTSYTKDTNHAGP